MLTKQTFVFGPGRTGKRIREKQIVVSIESETGTFKAQCFSYSENISVFYLVKVGVIIIFIFNPDRFHPG